MLLKLVCFCIFCSFVGASINVRVSLKAALKWMSQFDIDDPNQSRSILDADVEIHEAIDVSFKNLHRKLWGKKLIDDVTEKVNWCPHSTQEPSFWSDVPDDEVVRYAWRLYLHMQLINKLEESQIVQLVKIIDEGTRENSGPRMTRKNSGLSIPPRNQPLDFTSTNKHVLIKTLHSYVHRQLHKTSIEAALLSVKPAIHHYNYLLASKGVHKVFSTRHVTLMGHGNYATIIRICELTGSSQKSMIELYWKILRVGVEKNPKAEMESLMIMIEVLQRKADIDEDACVVMKLLQRQAVKLQEDNNIPLNLRFYNGKADNLTGLYFKQREKGTEIDKHTNASIDQLTNEINFLLAITEKVTAYQSDSGNSVAGTTVMAKKKKAISQSFVPCNVEAQACIAETDMSVKLPLAPLPAPAYLIMGYVPNAISLEEALLQFSFSLPERLYILDKVHHAVLACSEKFFVLGDLRPANILVTPSGDVILIDFGGSYMPIHKIQGRHYPIHYQPFYAPPEFWIPKALFEREKHPLYGSGSGDAYSLGVLFKELLCGNPYIVSRYHFKDLKNSTPMENLSKAHKDEVNKLEEMFGYYPTLTIDDLGCSTILGLNLANLPQEDVTTILNEVSSHIKKAVVDRDLINSVFRNFQSIMKMFGVPALAVSSYSLSQPIQREAFEWPSEKAKPSFFSTDVKERLLVEIFEKTAPEELADPSVILIEKEKDSKPKGTKKRKISMVASNPILPGHARARKKSIVPQFDRPVSNMHRPPSSKSYHHPERPHLKPGLPILPPIRKDAAASDAKSENRKRRLSLQHTTTAPSNAVLSSFAFK